ncbi:MAG: DNA-binding response regulator [Burkholderiaceae bacterium]|jgi:FixJ family two-component response regulator|uniref:response regulator transcription factor n=1 Tax=Polynucleobacter sp. HIN8 TaxID=3047867 RepID=UPI001DCE6980|nr:response regulator [Polynucleobacter sp. HIN8]MBU3726030.1 response regulator transcription factor [Polynucleobacter sp.]MBU6322964.1 response regulator [Burkholderiales bacterium]NBO86208.1 DNA-binding response regulator [Burkholderiaceae bacterium]NBP19192.1 DNA-binding response regulator [Burkholderiaceae bacterium]NBP96880.1 DNA-binding response regulator [Burkholderiaceae bacterium]
MSTLNGTIYLIDDDDAIRRSLSRMLADVGYDVFDYNSATSFLSNSRVVSPAVILLDMQMPDLSGLELLDCLEKNGSTTPIIFLSGQSHPQQIVKGLKKGALDFLFKPFNLEELLNAIQTALEYDRKQFKRILKTSEIKQNFLLLTPREKEVFFLLVSGLMNKEIAQQLGTTDATIKVHKARVMEKMRAASVQDLVRFHLEMN